MDRTVNQQFGKQAFDQAEKLFKDARVPENVQAIAQQGVAASKDLYVKTAAAAQDSAKAMRMESNGQMSRQSSQPMQLSVWTSIFPAGFCESAS